MPRPVGAGSPGVTAPHLLTHDGLYVDGDDARTGRRALRNLAIRPPLCPRRRAWREAASADRRDASLGGAWRRGHLDPPDRPIDHDRRWPGPSGELAFLPARRVRGVHLARKNATAHLDEQRIERGARVARADAEPAAISVDSGNTPSFSLLWRNAARKRMRTTSKLFSPDEEEALQRNSAVRARRPASRRPPAPRRRLIARGRSAGSGRTGDDQLMRRRRRTRRDVVRAGVLDQRSRTFELGLPAVGSSPGPRTRYVAGRAIDGHAHTRPAAPRHPPSLARSAQRG